MLVGVELEVHRPHHVRSIRRWRVDGRGPDAFAAPPLRDAQALVTPDALDLLVVYHPALGAGVVVRPSIPVAGMVLRRGLANASWKGVASSLGLALGGRIGFKTFYKPIKIDISGKTRE